MVLDPPPGRLTPDRVVILNDLSQPKGGATAVALESVYAMRASGLAVTLITGDAGDNPALIAVGVDIVALGGQRLRAAAIARTLIAGLYNRAAHAMVAQWIADHDTPGTIYHLHGWAQILSPAVFRALRPVRNRLLLSAHDYFLACPNGSFSYQKTGRVCPLVPLSPRCIAASCDRRNYAEKFWRIARQAIQRHYYQPASSPPVIAVHAAMAPFLERCGIPAQAITALPNPVRAWCATRIPTETNHEILFVGRLEANKGPDVALAAARAAGVTLRVIGDGPLRNELEHAYPEMIFTGALPHADIASHAAGARLLLMPSRYPEPYGLVAVEALWSGLPVLLPPTASLAPAIVAADAGMAVDPADPALLARTIATLLGDDTRIAEMSIAAFTATQPLGLPPEVWNDRLLTIYRQRLLAGRARPDAPPARNDGLRPNSAVMAAD
jgi:glycosyltransferase involved in cell wall biosynthesis